MKKYGVTAALIVINAVLFLIADLGGRFFGTELYRMGVAYYPFIVGGGEWYRLLSACFLHSSIEHLTGNMISLGVFGYRLEGRLGHMRMLLLYLAAGIAACAASIFINHSLGNDYMTLGASGAIFGIMGVLTVVLIRGGGRLDGVGLPQLAFAAAMAVYSGTQSETVDQIGHVAGLAAGLLLGALFAPRRNTDT